MNHPISDCVLPHVPYGHEVESRTLPKGSVFAVLQDEQERSGRVRASAQQFDDVGMVDVLQQVEFRQQILQFGRSFRTVVVTVRFGHFRGHHSVS